MVVGADVRYWQAVVAAGNHVAVTEACVFCDIVRDSVAADVVWRDDVVVAFLDRSPLFHGHTLVVPRRYVLTLPDLAVDEVGPFFERVRLIAAAMPGALGAQGTFVANNNVVSQSVAHLHVHVVPRHAAMACADSSGRVSATPTARQLQSRMHCDVSWPL